MFLCSCGREFQKIHGLEIHITRLQKSRPSETHERVEIADPTGATPAPQRSRAKVRAELPDLQVEVRVRVLGVEMSHAEFLKLFAEMEALRKMMQNSTKPEEMALQATQRQPNA